MKQRIITGFGIVAIIILLFFSRLLTTTIFDIAIVCLSMLAGYEMSRLLKKQGMYNSIIIVLAYPLLSYLLYVLCVKKMMALYLIFLLQLCLIIVLTALVALICMFSQKRSENEIKTRNLKITKTQFSLFKAIQTMFGMLYPAFLMMFFVLINNFSSLIYTIDKIENFGKEIALFALVLTIAIPVFTDTFAMLTGMLFKGKKLCPKISPKKTISGAIGGVIFGAGIAVALYFIFNSLPLYADAFTETGLAFWHFIILGLISSIICQLGDIFESFIKRKSSVKDSGNILPGHGGILDRFDSHIFNAPVVFIFFLILLI